MRKGHISLLLYDFAYITNFLCFQREPSGFISKDSILEGLRRRVEVRGSPGHQEQDNTRKADQGTAVHPQTSTTSRPEKWHDRAMGGATWVMLFRDFLFRESFSFRTFSFLSSCFRIKRETWESPQNLDLAFQFMLLDWQIIKIQQLFYLQHRFIQVCFSLFSPSILVLGFCVFYDVYQIEC